MPRIRQGARPEHDFTLISNELMRDPDLSDRAKAVYLFMRSHADGFQLNTKIIAEALGRSRNTIMAAMNDLIEAGYIDRIQGRIDEGRFGTVEYVVHATSARGSLFEQRSENDGECAQNLNTVCSKSEHDSAQNLNTKCSKSEPVKKKTKRKLNKKTNVGSFEDFYLRYPRKAGKSTAKAAYEKQLENTDAETLLTAVANFASECEGMDKKYIPHPSTWLNQERWRDYLVAAEKTTSVFDEEAPF